MPLVPGVVKGLGLTFKEVVKTVVNGAETVQYPHEKDEPAPRARGDIEGHKTLAPPRRAGGKPRSVNKLDRFDIDYSLCMYCGICVEVCPFEALFWSPEYEYSEPKIADLLHDKTRLGQWMETVPEFEAYEAGADVKAKKVPR